MRKAAVRVDNTTTLTVGLWLHEGQLPVNAAEADDRSRRRDDLAVAGC